MFDELLYIPNPTLQTLLICALSIVIVMHDYKLIGESPKVKSLHERSYDKLGDMTEYLTSENLMETANNLSKILSNIQFTWLSPKLKVSVES